jgi:hypothetical protein
MSRFAATMALSIVLAACGGRPSTPDPGRTVEGVYTVTYWTDAGGRGTPVADPSAIASPVAALVLGSGGYGPISSTVGVDGKFTIPLVPKESTYYLMLDGRPKGGTVLVRELLTSSPNINRDLVGRSGVGAATTATPVTLSVTNLEPWADGVLQVTSSNAGLWNPLLGTVYGLPTLAAGATSTAGQPPYDWSLAGIFALPDAGLGDEVWVHQLQHRTVPAGPGAGLGYWAAASFAKVPGFTVRNGSAATLAANLAPSPRTSTVTLTVPLFSKWEAMRADMGSPTSVAAVGTLIEVIANPYGVSAPAPLQPSVAYSQLPAGVKSPSGYVNPTLLLFAVASGQPDMVGVPANYGQFFDANYHEAVAVEYNAEASIAAPGALHPATCRVTAVRRLPMPATGPLSVDPLISPPKNPQVGGMSLFNALAGVGQTPTFTWSAPTLGTATSYTLRLFKLTVDASKSTLVDCYGPVLSAKVTTPSFRVPDGIITAGNSYFVTIQAAQAPYDSPEFGNEFAYPWAAATVISKPFTP